MFAFRVEGPINNNDYSGQYDYRIIQAERDMLNARLLSLRSFQLNIEQFIDSIITDVRHRANLSGDDRIQLRFIDRDNYFRNITTGMKRLDSISADDLMNAVARALQSTESLPFLNSIIQVVWASQIVGGAYLTALSYDEFVKRKTAIIEIVSETDCFFECLAVHQNLKEFSSKTRLKERLAVAQQLKAECQFNDICVRTQDFAALERFFHIRLWVLQFENLKWIFKSLKAEGDDMFLLYSGNHYHYIQKQYLGSLWNNRRFCMKCMAAYHDIRHKCISKCISCKREEHHHEDEATDSCEQCGFHVYNDCYDIHLDKVCGKLKRCPQCKIMYTGKEEHRCGYAKCFICKTMVQPATHECYIQQLADDDIEPVSDLYLFYDFECYFIGEQHHVGVAICMWGNEERIFKGPQALDEFCAFILHKRFTGYTCIAHNGARYDIHFIKRYMLKQKIKSEDLVHGSGILSIIIKPLKIRFIDSYRFIPIGLRDFAKTFSVEHVSKGYFPYRFFTNETFDYVGPYPELEYFDFDTLSDTHRGQALSWYETVKDTEFNLMDVCIEYCRDDVLLLKEGCLRFRQLFLDITQGIVDPFRYLTIATVCSVIYRRFYMPEKTIGIFGEQTRCTDKEYGDFFHNGRYLKRCEDGAYELFLDCYDNGCTTCFNKFTMHAKKGVRLYDLFWAFKQWKNECGLPIREVWSHSVDVVPDLTLRDAFFGGRTEVFKYHYRGGNMHYLDFTSLYPAVQSCQFRGLFANDKHQVTPHYYPVGHYTIIENPDTINGYFGFVHCDIEAPTDLYIPLLASRSEDDKLVFSNGRRTGIWTSVEIEKALQLGYRIHHIFRVYHFEQKSSDLFKRYVDLFLKIKQEASGYDGDIDAYVARYFQETGITLDPTQVRKNPGLRFIAKLCLNTLWGKFGQRCNFSQTVDTYNRADFENIVFSDQFEVESVELHTPTTRTIMYKKKDAVVRPSRYTNIAIAAFTTAYARLRLYQVLEHLQERVLYCDTDSVIFYGDRTLEVGDFLGDLTDELEQGDTIMDFVATAPKSYAYRTLHGKEVCKVKGFSLNFRNQKFLNYESMKRALDEDSLVMTQNLQFKISKDHSIVSQYPEKQFQVTATKRQRIEYETIPFIQ